MRVDREYEAKVNKLANFIKNWWIIQNLEQIATMFDYANRASAKVFLNKLVWDWLLEFSDRRYIPTSLLTWYTLFESVRAGLPFTPNTQVTTQIELNKFLIDNPNSTYLVRIKWDSMIEAGIIEGDIAIVDRSQNPKNWDIIIASIEWEVTIKYYEKKWDKITLIPANPNYKPIPVIENTEFMWVVVGTIRKYN